MAKWNNPMVSGKLGPGCDEKIDQAVFHQVQDERESGWLLGPWPSMAAVEDFAGHPVVFSRRFGIAQSDKVRAIDDLAESQVNRSFCLTEKLSLMGIDVVVQVARRVYEAVKNKHFRFRLSDGTDVSGVVHEQWYLLSSGGFPCILGRLLDLKCAYKQLGIARSAWKFSGLA
eukprot:6464270-Amphidinium_carterae.1